MLNVQFRTHGSPTGNPLEDHKNHRHSPLVHLEVESNHERCPNEQPRNLSGWFWIERGIKRVERRRDKWSARNRFFPARAFPGPFEFAIAHVVAWAASTMSALEQKGQAGCGCLHSGPAAGVGSWFRRFYPGLSRATCEGRIKRTVCTGPWRIIRHCR
jgi:hypothetical protein